MKNFITHPEDADGDVGTCSGLRRSSTVGGELEQSLEEEGRTGAASDIIKVKDWVQPF